MLQMRQTAWLEQRPHAPKCNHNQVLVDLQTAIAKHLSSTSPTTPLSKKSTLHCLKSSVSAREFDDDALVS